MELKDLQSTRFFQQFVKSLIISEMQRKKQEEFTKQLKQKENKMVTQDQKRKHSKNHSGYKGTKKPTTGCPICLDMFDKLQGGQSVQLSKPTHVLLQSQPTPPEKTNTYVYIVLDSSGSMHGIADTTRKTLKKTLDDIKVNAQKNNIDVFVSLRQFASRVADYDFDKVKSDHVLNSIYFMPDGMTALWDATGKTIRDMLAVDSLTGNKHSFLLIVITDGEENQSQEFTAEQLCDLMSCVQRTDRYTLTFQLPRGTKNKFCQRFGFSTGNVIEWDTTDRGMEQACDIQVSSFSNYATSRSKGVRSVTQYYTTDLSNIKQTDLNKLTPINNQAKILKVGAEADIKQFVEAQLGFYRPGSAFYQLSKDEKVQSYKLVLIRDKATKKIYAGDEARALIGLPACTASGGIIKVKVGNHANFDVFVQSSSNNRKLVRGTDLIIWN